MSTTLFEDIFDIRQLNPEGKRFEKVTRIVCKGVSYEMDLTLDVNSEVYPMKQGEKFTLALASTLDLDGKPDDGLYNQTGEPTLLDRYEYGMYGKVFRYEHEGAQRVYVSEDLDIGIALILLRCIV